MIFFGLISFLLNIAIGLIDSLFTFQVPVFQWGWIDDFFNAISLVFYLVPVFDLLPLIEVIIALGVIRIGIALARFIFDAIPLY